MREHKILKNTLESGLNDRRQKMDEKERELRENYIKERIIIYEREEAMRYLVIRIEEHYDPNIEIIKDIINFVNSEIEKRISKEIAYLRYIHKIREEELFGNEVKK